MDHPEGAGVQRAGRADFDRRVRVEFRGAQISSDGGLLVMRELDDVLGLSANAVLREKIAHWLMRPVGRPSLTKVKRFAAATIDLSPFSQIRALHASLHPWSVEDGALTRTLKVSRHVIAARFKSEVDELFQEMAVRKKNAGGAPLGVGGIEHQNRSKRTRQNWSGQK